jgi:uncharacterized integral membrane protein
MGRWIMLLMLALVVGVIAAFTIQNGAYTSPLQLDLGLAAWKLRRPASVPALMWSSFGVGFTMAALWGFWRSASLSREVRRLQQEVALAGTKPKDGWT